MNVSSLHSFLQLQYTKGRSTIYDLINCVRLASSVGRALERGLWVRVARESDFKSRIEKCGEQIFVELSRLRII